MVTELEVFEPPDLIPLDFCLGGWMKRQICTRKVDTRDELLGRISDAAAAAAAARTKKRTRSTHKSKTQFSYTSFKVHRSSRGGIFRTLTVNSNKSVIIV